jgi:hypothetical protein
MMAAGSVMPEHVTARLLRRGLWDAGLERGRDRLVLCEKQLLSHNWQWYFSRFQVAEAVRCGDGRAH